MTLAISGWSLCLSGWPEQAWIRAEQGIARAQELSHPFSLTAVLLHAAQVRQFRGELDQAWELAQRIVALGREYGFALYVAWGTITQGSILVQRGEPEEGIALITAGMAQYRATGGQTLLPYFLSFLAEAHLRSGQAEEGMKVVSETLHLTETIFDRFWAAELHRLKGELLLRVGERKKGRKGEQSPHSPTLPFSCSSPEACFHKAIEIARQQGAKSLELRAVMSLSRLWQQQGKRAEACQLLTDIYGWFTEGFDTKDLQEAKALLATLT